MSRSIFKVSSFLIVLLLSLCVANFAEEPKAKGKKAGPKGNEKAIRTALEKMGCKVETYGLDPAKPIMRVNFQDEKFKTGDVAKALPQLKKASELREIVLPGDATDDDLKAIAELKDLKSFEDVTATFSQVTDAGLLYLKPLPNLKTINVTDSKKVTREGIRKAFEALPSLELVQLGVDMKQWYKRDSK